MTARIDITGRHFGRLTVLRFSHTGKWGKPFWDCLCDCGVAVAVSGEDLRSGNTASCGCLHRTALADRTRKHGRTGTSVYNRWKEMIARCYNPKHPRFADYGGRGITVCERWLTFANFLADMGEPPPGLTLDRIDNDGNYEPGNCRWATDTQQRTNKRPRKLNAQDIAAIRVDTRTQKAIAAAFGVSQAAVWKVKNRLTGAHIPDLIDTDAAT